MLFLISYLPKTIRLLALDFYDTIFDSVTSLVRILVITLKL